MNKKICPMTLATSKDDFEYCQKEKCAWWTEAYNTENHIESGCALKIIAMKNSDGKIPV